MAKNITIYRSLIDDVLISYENGVLTNIMNGTDDRVQWDGLKHMFELYEENLDKTLFKQV